MQLQLDETILQTRTVKSIVGVLRVVVEDMNPILRETQQIYDIIKEHDKAMTKVKFKYE